MRRIVVFAVMLLLIRAGNAQVEVTALHKHNYGVRTHSFPLIKSADRNIADKINSTLQSEILDNEIVLTDTTKLFEKTEYRQTGANHQSGLSAIDFDVIQNTPFVLSVKFTLEGTGATTTYSKKYFTFDTRSGELMTIKNFMTPTGVEVVGRKLTKERDKRIGDWVEEMKKEINLKPDDITYINETFEKCNNSPEANNFFIEEDSVLFYKEDCFPHAARPYDTNLDVRISIKALSKYFSEAGQTRLLPPRKKRQKLLDDYRDELED